MNTNKKTACLLLSLVAAAILSACSSAQQAPAPVVSGTNTGGYGYDNGTVTTPYGTVNTPYGTTGSPTDTANNPYNTAPYASAATTTPSATPYTPAATTTPTAAPYTPATGTAYTPIASTGSTFIPNYSPVDKNASTHRVQAGDTVYNISKRYGISQEQLMQWNNLSGTTLSIGQTLRVKPVGSSSRTNAAPVTAAKTGTGSQHKVVAGDTVYNISKRYGISQEQLRQWNNLNGNNIQLGQVLRVSQSGRATSTATTAAAAPYVPAKQPAPAAVTTTNTAAATTTATTPAVVATPTPVVASVRTQTKDGIVWQSPLPNGSVTQEFGTNRGMLIDGKGANAVAAADGQVIHIGALRNYGNLLIVQHSDQHLTAYAQIASALVQNGQKVVRGQPVATLGSNKLLFEVRSDGKAVNPTTYIPF
ncbi:M23 family metallopeptidase [Kingella kingae]|uniref:M23 family metallopeptidase n=1 Tax=Kingella kingae TaxID=504 RepID=UPI0006677F4F|nr:M23 family metallopeptidase [Kingella kingae]MDK4608073.1 M23 family metallopeptidase [Kingella kingae]MDK4626046.1 M23 family metallopeptidase [Kingella kingae]